ncbi:MAG: hypothetical protein M1813_006125 [Trichoglossum hirsutum]|nr:MAG: hypothetical protein M1813_006125 [Trichoglossum hirsutum]
MNFEINNNRDNQTKGDGMYTDNAENAIYGEKLHEYLAFHGTDQGDRQRIAAGMGQPPPPISTAMITEEQFRQTQSYECQKQRFCTLDRENEPARWYASVEYQANNFGNVDAKTRGETAAKLALTMKRRSRNP